MLRLNFSCPPRDGYAASTSRKTRAPSDFHIHLYPVDRHAFIWRRLYTLYFKCNDTERLLTHYSTTGTTPYSLAHAPEFSIDFAEREGAVRRVHGAGDAVVKVERRSATTGQRQSSGTVAGRVAARIVSFMI
ncbi:hypothetical protein B0H11DRAFT_1929342 [Mycena galericulata]|nr:hypothetical protein B0H11DRAFT_1929342 [Mycena galericulata]